MNVLAVFTLGLGLIAVPFFTAPQQPGQNPDTKYIGAGMCKNCHNGADKGNAFDHWSQTDHAKAYDVLGSDKAKEVGKKLGVDDPQKSEKCLKCHVTAYEVDKKLKKPSLKMENGVQCESCHGPGEAHQKKRFAEAMKQGAEPSPITADEIHALRGMDTCKKCHNSDSPTYKPFCLKERMEKIEHLDPRKKRSEEDLKKLRATDAPDCEVCSKKKAEAGK